MKIIKVRANNFEAINTKYEKLIGQELEVYDQIDNHGDYCVWDCTLPFVFIPANLFKVVPNK